MFIVFFDSFFIYVILFFLFAIGVSALSSLAGFLATLNVPLIILAAIINLAVLIIDFYYVFAEIKGRSIVSKIIYAPFAALKSVFRFQISLLVVESIVTISTENIFELIFGFFGVVLCALVFMPEIFIAYLTNNYIYESYKPNMFLLIVRDIVITVINYKIFEWLIS